MRFVVRRLAYACVLLLAVVSLNFLLIHVSPGDPVETIAGSMGGLSEDMREQLRAQYGLDRPFLAQLGVYLGQVLQGNLGYSYFFNLPVIDLIWQRVPATLPDVPMFPPLSLKCMRTLATVRVTLSVAVSTRTAIPCGA